MWEFLQIYIIKVKITNKDMNIHFPKCQKGFGLKLRIENPIKERIAKQGHS